MVKRTKSQGLGEGTPDAKTHRRTKSPAKRRSKTATDRTLETIDETLDVQKTMADDEVVEQRQPKTAEEASFRQDALEEQLKQELSCPPPTKKVLVDFQYDNGDYLGLKLAEPPIVVLQVDQRPGVSPFWGKLYTGDYLTQLNGRRIKSLESFYQTLKRLKIEAPLTLTVERPIRTKPVTENRIKRLNIKTNSGDRYFTAYIFARPGIKKLGLSLKAHKNMVALLNVDENGLGYGAYQIGDIIMDVDGVPVKDSQATKRLIVEALGKRGFVSTVVMRPMTEQSLAMIRQILGQAGNSDRDPDMKIDATLIGRTEAMRRKIDRTRVAPKKGILVKPSTPRAKTPRLTATMDTNKNREHDIWSDVEAHDWGELESVPSRSDEEEESAAPKGKSSKKLEKIKKFLIERFTG